MATSADMERCSFAERTRTLEFHVVHPLVTFGKSVYDPADPTKTLRVRMESAVDAEAFLRRVWPIVARSCLSLV